jgi:hypothetical protein
MALGSRSKIIGDGIVATLNNDADLASRNFSMRKKPYNRGRSWLAGGFVIPMQTESPSHENVQDERVYRYLVMVVDPKDSDLVDGMESHLGAIERIENIFQAKSHSFMPNSIRTTAQTNLNTAVAAGKFSATSIQATDIAFATPFVDPAFEAGYDASSCIVSVRVLVSRFSSVGL